MAAEIPDEEDPKRNAKRARRNGSWSAIQQGVSIVANASIALLLVRAVPVAEYGIYSYALALTSIGIAIMTAGLSSLAVKALVNDRKNNASIVTSLLLTREGFALLAYVVIGVVSLTSGNNLVIAAALISAAALFGRAMDAPEMWFLSNLESKKTVVIRIGVTASLFGVRLALLYIGASIWVFLGVYVVESALVGSLILARYLRDSRSPGLGRKDPAAVKVMLNQSWPLLLSSVANQVNMKGDVVLIQALSGSSAVGVYAAAARLSELAYFLPVVFMNATLPHLLGTRNKYGASSREYKSMLQRSYDQAFWVGVGIALAVAVAGPIFIDVFFGERYAASKTVLLVHLIACPFIFMAAVYSKWIIAEGNLWSSVVRHGVGAALNICLNLALIPIYGVVGAAAATVASYIVASYVACFFGKKSREAGWQMTMAFIAPLRWAIARTGRGRIR